jgi:hypothetical protein
MHRPVGEMLDSMSYVELVKWGRYAAQEPFGEWRGDVRIAQLCALIANVNRDPKKRGEPYSVNDFMPFEHLKRPAAVQTEKTEGAKIDPTLTAWLFAQSRGRRQQRLP